MLDANSLTSGDGSPFYAVPANVGPRTMDYAALFAAGIYRLPNGISVLAGAVDDPFWIDLGATFDTLNLRKLGSGVPGVLTDAEDGAGRDFATDTVSGYAVNAIAIEVPIEMLTSTGKVEPASLPAATIGVWGTIGRPRVTIRRSPEAVIHDGLVRPVQRMTTRRTGPSSHTWPTRPPGATGAISIRARTAAGRSNNRGHEDAPVRTRADPGRGLVAPGGGARPQPGGSPDRSRPEANRRRSRLVHPLELVGAGAGATGPGDLGSGLLRPSPRRFEALFCARPRKLRREKIRVWALLGRHEFAAALELARVLNREAPDDVQVYGFLADAQIEPCRYAEAEKAAQWMLDLRPGNVAGLTRGAYLRELFGDLDGAVEFMTEAYTRTPPGEVEDRAWIAGGACRGRPPF